MAKNTTNDDRDLRPFDDEGLMDWIDRHLPDIAHQPDHYGAWQNFNDAGFTVSGHQS